MPTVERLLMPSCVHILSYLLLWCCAACVRCKTPARHRNCNNLVTSILMTSSVVMNQQTADEIRSSLMSEYYLNPFICWVHFFFKLFSCCVCKIRTITFLRFLIFLSISLSCIQTVNYMSAILKFYFIFYLAQQPPVGQGFLIHDVSRSHTTTRHSR